MRSAKLPTILLLLFVAVIAWLSWPRGAGPTDAPTDWRGVAAEEPAPERADAATAPTAAPTGNERTAVAPAPASSGPTFTVTGTILFDARQPIAGAKVRAFAGKPDDQRGMGAFLGAMNGRTRSERDLPFRVQGDPLASATVDAVGSFELRCSERHLRLTLDHDYHGLGMPEVVHVPTGSRTARVVLTPFLGGLIRGRLTGERIGEVRDVRLAVDIDPTIAMRDPTAFTDNILAAARPPVTPDADGRFTFTAVIAKSPFLLVARGDTVCGRIGAAPVQPGELRELLLPVSGGGALDVTVTDERGAPIAGAAVRATQPTTGGGIGIGERISGRNGETDADGHCRLSALQPGTWKVEASPRRRLATEQALEVRADETTSVTLACGSGGTVAGIVVAPDGTPVENAHVGHYPSVEIPLFGDMSGQFGLDFLAMTARDGAPTDAQGRFELTGIDDNAAFLLVAAHPDWAGGVARGVKVGERAARIEMQRQTGVRGRVLAAADQQPLTAFSVTAQASFFGFMRRTLATTRVDHQADGAFELTALPPGPATLVVHAEGHADAEREITLAAGTTTDIGAIELQRGASIHGCVRTADGKPVAAALVKRRLGGMLDNPALAMFDRGSGVSERTDRDGRFALDDLPPGRIQLQASASGYASTRSERFELAPGERRADVVLVLGHGGTVTGRLTTGPGVRPDEFLAMAQEQQTQATASAPIAADGTFRIENLDPGRYHVQAMRQSLFAGLGGQQDWKPGKGVEFGKMMAAITRNVVATRCAVRDGEVTEVELDATDLDNGAELVLRVEIAGQPLAGGLVELTAMADGQLRTAFAENGTVTFAAMAPGTYRAQVRGGITLQPIGGPQTVEFPAGASSHRATLQLPGGELSGRVVDIATGEPLRHALVRLLHQDERERDDPIGNALTDADGAFAFPGLADGVYGLVAADTMLGNRDGATSRVDGLRVLAGQRHEPVLLRAAPGASVSAVVTDDRGLPVAGAMLLCVDEAGHALGGLPIAVSGADGKAVFGGMPAGRLRVVGRGSGLAPGASDLQEVRLGATVEFALRLQAGTTVTLQAVDRAGKALARADVSARCNDGAWFPALLLLERHGAEGHLELGRLTPGAWEFRISHPAVGTFTARRTVGSTAATLVLTPP